jgi:sulfonate transport system substrate-binding protein
MVGLFPFKEGSMNQKISALSRAIGVLFLCSQGMAQGKPVVRIGYQPTSSAILVGKAKGFYEKAFAPLGVQVEYDFFLSGPLIIEAAAGDRVDLMNVGNMPPIIARAGGIDVKVIAKAGFNPATNAILVRPDSPLRSIADLKGKKVAAQVGSSVHYFLYQVLKANGLSMEDVHLVNLAGPDQGPALESGSVDAIVLWMPYRTQLEMAGKARVLVDSSRASGNLGVFMVRNDFGKKNPELVAAFLKATQRANDYLRHHPRECLEILAANSQFPKDVLAKSLEGFHWSMALTREDVEDLKGIKDFLKENKVIRKDFDIHDLVDTRYLNGAGPW